jgi:hypothetical protein
VDLVAAITNLQANKLNAAVQVSVARKILDSAQMQGGAALKLLSAATNGVAQAGDELTAQAIGLGGSLDTYA